MDRDFRKPVYTLLGLFGLLGVLILVFMLTGDMTAQPLPRLHTPEPAKPAVVTQVRATQPTAGIPERNFSLPAVQYNSPASDDTLDNEVEAFLQDIPQPVKDGRPKTSTGICNLEDGNYKATVSYNDAKGPVSLRKVDVTVLNCQVIAMDLPKLGWMDGDQFAAATINGNNEARFEDNKKRMFEVHINSLATKE